ncbi:MerR family transcriptional regulator [Salicibibacter cibi]|uniref:MerR family transcriptional regulator n=1 Tax=Salicibibacter cibi TaxID=2743001 RepID=A0A7T6Z9Q9_9BACI|nr:MerR family transcriptional regulator [Salicibibacter cibi]QQK79001.1 MerR family transcriptional regulator [Salicibibacter cibi]
MESKTFTVGKFAKLTGVTERTLRYYDRKGLLAPSEYNKQGHRLYTENDLFQLQRILTLKYLDFSLGDIAEYLEKSGHDLKNSLAAQTGLLQQKREHLDQVIGTIERVQAVIQERENQMDSDLLLGLIHAFQREEDQKQWMANHMSKELLDRMFMEGKTAEEKLEFERKITSIFSDISLFYHEGRPVDDLAVQEKGLELMKLLTEVFEQEYFDELEGISEGFGEGSLSQTKFLTNEVEAYLADILSMVREEER